MSLAAFRAPAPLERDGAVPETGHAEYDALPEPIKRRYTLEQYLWLPDRAKGGALVQSECEPDWTE